MPSGEAELLALHDRFCQGFADRRPELVLETVAPSPDLVVVTSEDAVLRGIEELRTFLHGYAEGATTYSWTWDRRDTATFGTLGSLLALGTESAESTGSRTASAYRMTLAAHREADRWAIVQVHGSSPHQA